MSKSNLIPVTKRSKAEAREISKKGGVASGQARREKRDFREAMKALLDLPAEDLAGMTNREAICAAMVQKAVGGDKGAAEFCMGAAGENPTSKVDVTSSDGSMTPAGDLTHLALADLYALTTQVFPARVGAHESAHAGGHA